MLSKQEIKRLLKAPEHLREKVMIALTYDTGLRMQELSNLLVSDVDLDRAQMHIRNQKINDKNRNST